jgi:hypothetical protein
MNFRILIILFTLAAFMACGTSKSADQRDTALKETLNNKNRLTVSLLDQIRRLPGVVLRNGVPVFTKNTNSIAPNSSGEPLYVLNDYIVGNSFRDVNQMVENVNVDKIETLTDSEASFYGSRAANGVIKITTVK